MTNSPEGFRIRGHEPVSRQEDWLRIVWEGRDPLEVPISIWIQFGLKDEMIVHNDMVEALVEESNLGRWKLKLLHYLSYRARSEEEVRRHLARKGASAELATRVVAWARDEGWLNDKDYAVHFIESQAGRASRREISWKLAQRGVHPEVVDTVLQEMLSSDRELEAALTYARKSLRRNKSPEPRTIRQKIGAQLQRKGYSMDIINQVFDRLTTEIESIAQRCFLDND